MSHPSSDFLARKLQQNWLSRCHDLKWANDQEVDDSLTNLSWLQNISLTKLTAPDTPLSSFIPPPLSTQPQNLLGSDAIFKDADLQPQERTLRKTLELYRQHCCAYGSGQRPCQPPKSLSSRQTFSADKYPSGCLQCTQRQPSTWWKSKAQRNICRSRNIPQHGLKVKMDVHGAAGSYLPSCQLLKGMPATPVYRGIATTNCYKLPDGQTLVSLAQSLVPNGSRNYSAKRGAEEPIGAFCNDPRRFGRDVNVVDELPLTCVLPTIDDLGADEKQMFQTNQSMRPPFSYIALIYMSMEATKRNKITLNEIYSWVAENFAFYRKSESTWKLALRQTLMRSVFFRRVPRRKEEPGGWGDIWRLNPEIRSQLTGKLKVTPKSPLPATSDAEVTVNSGLSPKAVCRAETGQVTKVGSGRTGNSQRYWRNEGRERVVEEAVAPSTPSSPGLLELVQEDVSLLENTLDGCQSVLDTMNEESRQLKPDSGDLDNLLYPSNAALLHGFKREAVASRSDSDDQSDNLIGATTHKLETWWPEDLSDTVTHFIDNHMDETLADVSMGSERVEEEDDDDDDDQEDEKERVGESRHSTQSPESFQDLTMDYPMGGTSMIADGHPWVDDRLNLEELDTILGLN